jgi:hypothetical protein
MMKLSAQGLIAALSLCLRAQHSAAFGLPSGSRFVSSLGVSTVSTSPITGISSGGGDDEFPLIVPFGGSAVPQGKPDKQVVGGKGLGLQIMSGIGVSVPPGFTLTTAVCQGFQETGDLSEELWDALRTSVKQVEKDTGKGYGKAENPLLFSCRSGAAVSMPGMMDTVLNIVRFSIQGSARWLILF